MKLLLNIALLIFSIGIQAQNVGINTTTPQAALDVQGDVILRNVNITLVNGANENVNVLSSLKKEWGYTKKEYDHLYRLLDLQYQKPSLAQVLNNEQILLTIHLHFHLLHLQG